MLAVSASELSVLLLCELLAALKSRTPKIAGYDENEGLLFERCPVVAFKCHMNVGLLNAKPEWYDKCTLSWVVIGDFVGMANVLLNTFLFLLLFLACAKLYCLVLFA